MFIQCLLFWKCIVWCPWTVCRNSSRISETQNGEKKNAGNNMGDIWEGICPKKYDYKCLYDLKSQNMKFTSIFIVVYLDMHWKFGLSIFELQRVSCFQMKDHCSLQIMSQSIIQSPPKIIKPFFMLNWA